MVDFFFSMLQFLDSFELIDFFQAFMNLVQWNNNILKENHVFFSQRHSKTWDNACKDIKHSATPLNLWVSLIKV